MKLRAYLDIETTGLSRYKCDLTVIGIAVENGRKCQVIQLIEDDLYEEKLLKILKGIDEIYTYNGSRFDLPFIETKLGVDLKECFQHTDLMYDCWVQAFCRSWIFSRRNDICIVCCNIFQGKRLSYC